MKPKEIAKAIKSGEVKSRGRDCGLNHGRPMGCYAENATLCSVKAGRKLVVQSRYHLSALSSEHTLDHLDTLTQLSLRSFCCLLSFALLLSIPTLSQ